MRDQGRSKGLLWWKRDRKKEEDPTEVGLPIIQRPHTRSYLKVSINSKLSSWGPKLQRWA